MGHYDECREEYCGICGQTEGNCDCENTKKSRTIPSECMPQGLKKNEYGCKSCQKSDVCKWSKEFSAFAKLAEESIPGDLSDFVKVEATCKYYHQKPQGGIR